MYSYSREQIQKFKGMLKCFGDKLIQDICDNVGLNATEESIIKKVYGRENKSVVACCLDLNISESTFKRKHKSAITKIINSGILDNELL